jgi:hypothetical protein
MLTYDTPRSRNRTGQKTLPTIWGTYMKLVTKYQISAINSIAMPPLPEGGGGILFYLCPSVRPSVLPSVQDMFRRIFLSNC